MSQRTPLALTAPVDCARDTSLGSVTRSADSGRTLRCRFCPECGVRIDHLPDYAAGIAALKPGTLDDRSWLSPAMHFWTSSREAWVELPVDVVQHPRQP